MLQKENALFYQRFIKLRLRKPYPQHWYDISFGFSNAHICLTINSQTNQKGCEIYIPDSKQLLHCLYEDKQEIEEKLGESLQWEKLPEKKASRIKLLEKADLADTENWEEIHQCKHGYYFFLYAIFVF